MFNIRKGLDSNACAKQEEEKKIQKKEEERRKIIEKPDLVTSVIPAVKKLRQEDDGLEASLECMRLYQARLDLTM